MNLREGTRRLALLLGVLGAIAGGFVSYSELQDVRQQQASYLKFEQLAVSSIAQQARKNCFLDNPPPGYAKLGSQLQTNSAGIEVIEWTDDCRVDMIKTDAGECLYPELAPRFWEYLLIALLPIFGFFIPLGAIRAIGWVGDGFATGSK